MKQLALAEPVEANANRTMATMMMTLAACGAQPAAQAPVEVTRVVVQEVTREVVWVDED